MGDEQDERGGSPAAGAALTVHIAMDQTSSSLFIDAENVYYYLLNNSRRDMLSPVDIVVELVRGLRAYAAETLGAPISIAHAYADFEQMESGTLSSLYLTGVETHNVLGAEHKNAADMRLCIDAMETLYRRPAIGAFILLAGDRDYIPVVQHLRKEGKRVILVAFRGTLSGDLLQVIGVENYVDAMSLLSKESVAVIARELQRDRRIETQSAPPASVSSVRVDATGDGSSVPASNNGVVNEPTAEPTAKSSARDGDRVANPEPEEGGRIQISRSAAPADGFEHPVRLSRIVDREALIILLKYFGQHDEIWVGPFLRRLSEDLTHLAYHERKAVMDTLIFNGVARLEQRTGYPRDYAVLVLNENHPDVYEMRESVENGHL